MFAEIRRASSLVSRLWPHCISYAAILGEWKIDDLRKVIGPQHFW
jgi:hypothetical protein